MNEKKYLDYDGLHTLVSAFKDLFPLKTDVPNDIGFVSGGYSTPLVLTTLKKGFYILSSIGTLYYKADESSTTKNYNDDNLGCPFAILLTRDFENTATTYQLGYILTYANDGRITYYNLNWSITKLWATDGKISNNYGSLLTDRAQTFYGSKTFNQFPLTPSSAPTTDYQTANKKYVDDQVATKTIQYTTMPTASVDNLGNIVQYVGATDSTYTNGYFYVCVSDGQDPATYSWINTNVQSSTRDVHLLTVDDGFTSSNPFVFADRKPGIYCNMNTHSNPNYHKYFYAKTKSNCTYNLISGQVIFIAIDKNISEMTSDGYFATLFIVNNGVLKMLALNTTNDLSMWSATQSEIYGGFLTESSQSIYGTKTFNSFPITPSSAPTTDYQTANKKYVDDQDVALLNNIASVYNSSNTYNVGDYVIYNNLLYVCNTAITTAEAWTAAHWTQTTVMAEIKNSIGNINTTLATLATPSSNGGGN